MELLKNKIIREIVGVIFFAGALFLMLSLLSYDPKDPSYNHKVETKVFKNLGGKIGAYVADPILSCLGCMAFLVPFLFILMGWSQFKLYTWPYILSQFIGTIVLIGSTCGIFFLYTVSSQYKLFKSFPYGGILGDKIISTYLVSYFNVPGTLIILLTAIVISIMLMARVSLTDVASFVRHEAEKIRHYLFHLRYSGDKKILTEDKIIKPFSSSPSSSKKKKRKRDKKQVEEEKELEKLAEAAKDPLPPITLLEKEEKKNYFENKTTMQESAQKLTEKLLDFGVQGKVVQILPGPVVTRYEFEPAPGIKISKVSNLSDDIALAMKALSVRIVAPVPGKSVIGLEIPNQSRQKVYLREILESEQYTASKSKLTLALGKDIEGIPYVTDLAKMPHLLVAGATGAGKSVSINAIICSLLFNASADSVKFIMIDPKMLELGIYNDIPHLLTPVVVNPKEAANALRWATMEMENRYRILAEKGVRNIDQFNLEMNSQASRNQTSDAEGKVEPLPYIVIVIDEFADLMIMSSKEVETLLIRLAQMARAVGIHLIIATQRPSVDVVTGLIKANFPCRISFRVSSKIDSRTILDANGAERLLGHGDMLFLPPNSSDLIRLHGSFITETEIKRVVKYLSIQGKPEYNEGILTFQADEKKTDQENEEYDDLYDKALDLVVKTRHASISMIQRRLRIGYNRAARMIEIMEREGVVSKPNGSKPREVIVGSNYEN